MFRLLLLKITLFFNFICSAQIAFRKEENTKDIIKANKVTKETIYLYSFKKNEIKDSSIRTILTYDNYGNVIKRLDTKTENTRETVRNISYAYDAQGKIIKQIEEVPEWSYTIYQFEYDSLGNEIVKYDYNKDTTRLTIEQKVYNQNNQVVALWTKINRGDTYNSRRYFYNEGGELIKMEAFDTKGNNTYSYIIEDDKVLQKKSLFFENSEGRKLEEELIYNNYKQPVKVYEIHRTLTFWSPNSQDYDYKKQVIEYSYNQDKTIFEKIIYQDGKKVSLQRHYYSKE